MTLEQAREQLAKAEAARSASRADHAAAQRALLDANGLLQDAKEAQERAEEAQERALDYRLLADAEVLDAERGVEAAAARAQQADADAVLAARKLDELVREARAEQPGVAGSGDGDFVQIRSGIRFGFWLRRNKQQIR